MKKYILWSVLLLTVCLISPQLRAQRPVGIDSDFNCCAADWPTIAASGVQFACIKATEWTHWTNNVFANRIAGAQAAGLYVIPYHRCNPSINTPQAEAQYLWNWASSSLGPKPLMLSPALDVEDGLTGPYLKDGGGSQSLAAWCNQWFTDVQSYATAAGFNIQQLTYVNVGKTKAIGNGLNGLLWLADPCGCDPQNSNPYLCGGCTDSRTWDGGTPTGGQYWSIWQYQWASQLSSPPPGLLERVDFNVFNGTLSQMVAALGVTSLVPLITRDLPSQVSLVPDGNYIYSPMINATPPISYQWYNDSTLLTDETNSSYTAVAGSLGSSTTYWVAITNAYGAVTSTVSTVTVIDQLTNSYATNILQFNPVGYWPMHEVAPAVQGDTETNYGSLGLLGTGYYPDWATSSGAFKRGSPGALAGDTDRAVYFTQPASNGGGATNSLCVPHTSPLSTLNPPFSVECWFYGTNSNQGDIWSQNGYEGLNAGNTGGGAGNVCGMRLYWNGGGFTVYSYYNASTLRSLGSQSASIGQWYHLVVTADNNTNISLYVNGNQAFTSNAVGAFAPDYWTPFEVGNGRGNTRGIKGIVDEVAIYTNVLADISAHYAAGISANPTPTYFQLVTNDYPVIYLRMDASAYTAPPAASWPQMINYGSVSGNGVYSPGTMPGIVPGPTDTNGSPFNALSSSTVAQFGGISSFADAGYSPAYDPVGPVPFTLTAMFRANPADGRIQTIVGHSDNSYNLTMRNTGQLQWRFGTNTTANVFSSGIYNDGKWHQAVVVYTPASVPSLPGTNALYVDGVLDNFNNTASPNGFGPGSPLDLMIAGDPQYNNNPVGLGRQFAGQVCEVALFTNALSPVQVQQLCSAVFQTPAISVANSGTNFVLTFVGNTLLSSTNAAGPYTPVSGATSPYSLPLTNAQQFFRARAN